MVVLPAPLGPEEGDELALFDLEVDAADRLDQPVSAAKQPADGRAAALLSSGIPDRTSPAARFR